MDFCILYFCPHKYKVYGKEKTKQAGDIFALLYEIVHHVDWFDYVNGEMKFAPKKHTHSSHQWTMNVHEMMWISLKIYDSFRFNSNMVTILFKFFLYLLNGKL